MLLRHFFRPSSMYHWGADWGGLPSEPVKSYRSFLTDQCVCPDWLANRLTGSTSHKRQLLFIATARRCHQRLSELVDWQRLEQRSGWLARAADTEIGTQTQTKCRTQRNGEIIIFFPSSHDLITVCSWNFHWEPAGNDRCSVLVSLQNLYYITHVQNCVLLWGLCCSAVQVDGHLVNWNIVSLWQFSVIPRRG